jgi:hypothetical protein
VNTDRWYYRVFQSAPDLIRSLLPGSAAANANTLGFGAELDAAAQQLNRCRADIILLCDTPAAGSALKGEFEGLRRLRVGHYRVGHRREVYR